MDPEIWSRLPEDILERVLSFLPLKTFLSLRSTCKHFKSLLFSPSFISKHSPASPTSSSSPFSSFLLLSHHQFSCKCPLYDTVQNAWRNLPLSYSPTVSPAQSCSLLSVSHGRLCFSHPSSSSFIVCNLLSRSSRVVKYPKFPCSFESLTLVSTSTGYKLLMMSSSGSSNTAFVYDSGIHLWQQFQGINLILNNQGGVFHEGKLYFITTEPFHILCFDLETGSWERSPIQLPNQLAFARLVSDGDRKLYLIGGIGSDGISRSLKLWELSGDGENWAEVERLPEMMVKKFLSVCYHKYEHVYCFWHEGLLCVCCYTWPEVLYYKVSRKTWHWLPKCPLLTEKWSCGFKWFSFVPQLYSFA
ncbi:unnamed protein product [Coffea canephora]|uniref:F-box domain-containing protein n=2 Tax=Coffea TaxID=13442 RepID=A0A068TZ78_COFCA|nr:F-box/kelch-repeat protein At5g43190-like [Coffea arabica]CDP01199.1 unnamed protein product [Coffea canephora]